MSGPDLRIRFDFQGAMRNLGRATRKAYDSVRRQVDEPEGNAESEDAAERRDRHDDAGAEDRRER